MRRQGTKNKRQGNRRAEPLPLVAGFILIALEQSQTRATSRPETGALLINQPLYGGSSFITDPLPTFTDVPIPADAGLVSSGSAPVSVLIPKMAKAPQAPQRHRHREWHISDRAILRPWFSDGRQYA
jgi:hypothetical protein